MNEKLSRPQFNQMDTTEKQTLMESLAARYNMTFLDLHTFDRWGQSMFALFSSPSNIPHALSRLNVVLQLLRYQLDMCYKLYVLPFHILVH